MPKVYVIDDPAPNAFATGRNPEHGVVAVTTGIRRLLSTRELRGVLAHELAHVKNRDILISTVAATIATAITYLAHFAMFFGGRSDDRDSPSPLALLAMALLAPIAAGLIQMAISRQREFAADRGGAEIAGSPDGLAMALRRLEGASKQIPMNADPATAHMFIVKPFTVRGMAALFSTHPPTEQRIAALMALK
jgi:heat shock protein HtpX